MRAAYYESNGPAREVLKLGELEEPLPGPGEVRVKLAASGVNPSDVKSRLGLTRKIAFPRIVPHSDGAGVVDRVGAGIDPRKLGERVWTWNAQWKRAFGTAAEYVTLPERLTVPLPAQVGFEEGACLGIPAMTAAHAVAAASVRENSTVLISGGAGAVGNYAIQFAKARGAIVLATVSSETKARLARQAGADHVIDYKRSDVAAQIQDITHGGVDIALELDVNANAKVISAAMRPRGVVIVYGVGAADGPLHVSSLLFKQITLKFILVYELTDAERAAAIADITRLMNGGTLIHNVARAFPLSEIAAAHEAVESGAVAGNVVVRL